MVVRGAPAIGAAAAYGVVLAAQQFMKEEKENFLKNMENALNVLSKSRPTAVNLTWAIGRMRGVLEKVKDLSVSDIYEALKEEANKIYFEDLETNKKMAKIGNEVIKPNAVILTHCNTGALATVGYGTALGVIREAHYSGKNIFVYADETRPRLQGAKLTAWELVQEGIPAKLIADSVAATLIRDGKIDIILVGADRIALNGDTANKIGTFMLSVVAKVYNVPFYVVAPTSTIDFNIETGAEIVIEERSPEEVTHINGVRIAPEGIDVYNPAFDVTPHENITGIITEKGIIRPPFRENILKLR
ncbi:translation initiation factor eIF-2B alpha subunit [Caldanaerobacter subterraneus subsp. pacificus DSM 12653]|nr:translation initiation factor eIF-2B alpha subunit [Caldanaerobacter subterraneus subsp. pacificus DSM 12653]